MSNQILTIRNQTLEDIPLIVDYFLDADVEHMQLMGVDRAKLFERSHWLNILKENYLLEDAKKNIFYIIWLLDNQIVGHCNINKIKPNKQANMHLHLWTKTARHKGLGFEFLKLSIPIFFNIFNLQKIYCEPYALNPAPNKTLEKLGFELVNTYKGIPGTFSFPQQVNKWCLTKDKLNINK